MVSSGIGVLVGCGSSGDVGSFLVACVAVFLVCSDLLDTGVAVLVLVGRFGLFIAALGLGSFLDSGAGVVTVLFLSLWWRFWGLLEMDSVATIHGSGCFYHV